MSVPTTLPAARAPASDAPAPERGRRRMSLVPPERSTPAFDAPVPTPLYTRHMLGVIEAERDRRRQYRAANPRPRVPEPPRARTLLRPMSAVITDAGVAAASPSDTDRWADEGGSVAPEAVPRFQTTTRS